MTHARPPCRCRFQVWTQGKLEVWAKELSGGRTALLLFNLGDEPTDITAVFRCCSAREGRTAACRGECWHACGGAHPQHLHFGAAVVFAQSLLLPPPSRGTRHVGMGQHVAAVQASYLHPGCKQQVLLLHTPAACLRGCITIILRGCQPAPPTPPLPAAWPAAVAWRALVGLCSRDVPEASKQWERDIANDDPVCFDKDEGCPKWAAAGECKNNAGAPRSR